MEKEIQNEIGRLFLKMDAEYERCFGLFRPMRLYENGLSLKKYTEGMKCCIDSLGKLSTNVIKRNKKVLNLLGVGVNQVDDKFHTVIITKNTKEVCNLNNVIVKDYAKCKIVNCKYVIVRESAEVEVITYERVKNETFSYNNSVVEAYGFTKLIADDYTRANLHGKSRCNCRQFANIKCLDESRCDAGGYSFVTFLDNSTGVLCSNSRGIIDNNSNVLVNDNACFTTYGSPKVKVMSYGFGDIYGTPEVYACAGNPTLKIHDEFSNTKMTGLNITVTHGTVISQRPFDSLKLGGFAIHRMDTKGIIRTREGDIQLKYKEHLKQM